MCKIILVHGKYFNSWEALGLGYIGSYVKSKISNVSIKFYQGNFDSVTDILGSCVDADFLFFSATSPSFNYCLELAQKAKKTNSKLRTVFGGYHVSALGQECLVDGIDQIVVGEGEEAVVDIINGNTDTTVYGRQMLFEELFWPDRDLIKNERNIQVSFQDTGKRITSFQSHRACPFRCKYCADGHMKVLCKNAKPIFRARPIKDLLTEINSVTHKYSLDVFKFCDATWNISKEYVKDFCRAKMQYGPSIPFFPNIHANMVDDEMFALLKKANCYEIGLGIESGSPKILREIGKGTTIESIRNACDLAKKNEIKVRGYFILGMPNENEEDLVLTEKFAEELEIEEYGFTILCPYPGTTMYEDNKSEFKDTDWSNTDEYINDFWYTKYLSNKQLREWQSKLVNKFKNKITWHNKIIEDK